MDLGRTFPESNFLWLVTLRHYSNNLKEADILDRCRLALNGGGGGLFNRRVKIEGRFFKSLEQCRIRTLYFPLFNLFAGIL